MLLRFLYGSYILLQLVGLGLNDFRYYPTNLEAVRRYGGVFEAETWEAKPLVIAQHTRKEGD